MPRYYFNIVRGVERIVDANGIELLNDELAAVAWPDLLEEIRSEEPDLFQEHEGWSLEIVDTNGRVIRLVPLTP
jgi:hypothetical protein